LHAPFYEWTDVGSTVVMTQRGIRNGVDIEYTLSDIASSFLEPGDTLELYFTEFGPSVTSNFYCDQPGDYFLAGTLTVQPDDETTLFEPDPFNNRLFSVAGLAGRGCVVTYGPYYMCGDVVYINDS
jgi:hypothetical protein